MKLRNTKEPVHVYAPAGAAAALLVEQGQVVDVPGELVREGDDGWAEDAHTIRTPSGELRAWSAERWALVDPPKPARSGATEKE